MTNDIVVEGAESARDRLLHEEGKGFTVAMATLDGGRIGIAAQALGIAQAAYDVAREYAKERRTFGKAIAELQAIQWKLADMSTEIDAARLLVYRAAWLKEQGGRTPRRARRRSSSRRRWRGGRRPRRSRSSAATATRRSSRSSASTATRRSRRSTRARARSSGSSSPRLGAEAEEARVGGAASRTPTSRCFLADRSPELAAAHDQLYPERLPENIPLSLTLLYPFAPVDQVDSHREALRSFFAAYEPFELVLDRLEQWDEGGAGLCGSLSGGAFARDDVLPLAPLPAVPAVP